MSKGLRVPLGANPLGGIATTSGDEQAIKVIGLTLGNNDSDSAFQQDIGLGEAMLFRIQSAGVRASIVRRLVELFDDFTAQHLYKLDRSTIQWRKASSSTMVLEFKFLDMESDEVQSFVREFKAAS